MNNARTVTDTKTICGVTLLTRTLWGIRNRFKLTGFLVKLVNLHANKYQVEW